MRILFAMLGALTLSACAFGDEKLTLAYAPEAPQVGVISEAPQTDLTIATVTDARPDRKPVGKDETADPKRPFLLAYKRNGFGQKTGNVVGVEPAVDTVKAAIEQMLAENGHAVVDNAGEGGLTIAVKDLWLEVKPGAFTVEFSGNAAADIELVDARTGEVVFSDSFTGFYSSRAAGGLSGTWTKILNAAVADLVRNISLSTELKEALDQLEANGATS